MSTRTAKSDSTFHQGRYASSPEFERGLLGNLVAKRAAMLDSRPDRELVWAVHFLSHQDGGLAAVARELLARFPERIGPRMMPTTGKTDAQSFTAEEMREIRLELPTELRHRFPLKGETKSEIRDLAGKVGRLAKLAEIARALRIARENSAYESMLGYEEMWSSTREEEEKEDREAAAKHPATYPVATLRALCLRAAADGMADETRDEYRETVKLERELADMCLDPEWDFELGGPWYFRNLVETLRVYLAEWTSAKTNWPETKLGRIIADEFDYTWHACCMSRLEGEARRGKSFAAKHCCLKNPGRARFVEVPPGNDDTSFFRSLARGLGLGNFLKYKTIDIRERVESVLLSGDLLLVLDEGQRLWPQCNQRYAKPARIEWLMAMVNAKVPILIISTPQFTNAQKVAERIGWNSAQFTGRTSNYKFLPASLELPDLLAVCRAMLPEAREEVLRGLAAYARKTERYLAAIESVAMRARYLAGIAGREHCNTEDVSVALQESVIPSDSRLIVALEKSRAELSRRRLPAAPLPEPPALMDPQPQPARNRLAESVSATSATRRANMAEFAPV